MSNLSGDKKIVADLKTVVADAEEILRGTADVAGEKATDLRQRIGERLSAAKLKIADVELVLSDKAKAAACAADAGVRENPWQSVGVAAGLGFLLGVLIGRR